jgi:hypothetical protein
LVFSVGGVLALYYYALFERRIVMKTKRFGSTLMVVALAITVAAGVGVGRAVALDCTDNAPCKSHWCFVYENGLGVFCDAYINAQALGGIKRATSATGWPEFGTGENTRIIPSDCQSSCGDGTWAISSFCDIEPDAEWEQVDQTVCFFP